jgi:hypothetical protein
VTHCVHGSPNEEKIRIFGCGGTATMTGQAQVVSASSADPVLFRVDWIVSPCGKRCPSACSSDNAVSSLTGVLNAAVSAATGVLVMAVSLATGVLNIAVSDATGVLEIAVSEATGVLEIAVSEATGVLRIAVSLATGVLDTAVSDATSVAWAGAVGLLTAQFNTNGLSSFPELNVPNGKVFELVMIALPLWV